MSNRIPVISKRQVISGFPRRSPDSHKGLSGTVAVIGGTSGMIGAPLLAARAALKLGAGCVYAGLLADHAPGVDALQAELMLCSASSALLRPRLDVVAIGCGMGTSISSQKLLYDALLRDVTLVIDADALNLLAQHSDLQADLCSRKAPSVLTPHPGEAARLLDCSVSEVQSNRTAATETLAQRFRCSILLKGAGSLCMTRDGKLHRNTTGNPGMSSAGMGDVLTGMIAAFIAQGMSTDDALLLAVHLHGAAGDALQRHGIGIGMTATDVTEWARWLLNQWSTPLPRP